MEGNTPYPPATDTSPYPPVSESSIAAVPTTTPYPPAADIPYPPATGTPHPPAATDTSNPPATTTYPAASTTPYPPATDTPTTEGAPVTNAPTQQTAAPAGDQSKTDDAQPPPYSPPTAGYPLTTGYPPPSMMAYPPQPQPGFHPGDYQTAPPMHSDAIIRSTQHGPQPVATAQVVVGFNQCPKCRVGTLQETFTPAGICCAIFLFPLGLLFCLIMRRKICTHCGAIYM